MTQKQGNEKVSNSETQGTTGTKGETMEENWKPPTTEEDGEDAYLNLEYSASTRLLIT